jgi:HD-GYP domain-containing protein (c-di-GMP phosphodiesterase class II)
MKRRKIEVDKLEFGMYVAELDRPWTDTPFAFQGFHLRTDKQWDALRKFCKHVFIDLERTEALERREPPPTKPKEPPSPPKPQAFPIRGTTTYPQQADVETEFRQAETAYDRTVKNVEDLLRPLAQGQTVLDGKEIRESVTRLTDSVVRNPDALLLVTRLKETSAAMHARALQVSIYMIVFGRFLELPREDLELLGLLGLLQDVGKTQLPASIMEKQGPLTPEQNEIAKKHVDLSVEILKQTPGLPEKLPELARLHHERPDAKGYPRGLKADEIGLYGSIAAIADTFDALTAVRPYAELVSPSAALGFLYRERGTGFHAELVEQFIQCIGVFPVGSVVELNSGEIGIVITQNLVRRLKPRVMIVLDASGSPMRPHKILDLDKDPDVAPELPYRIRRTLEQTRVQVDPRDLFI